MLHGSLHPCPPVCVPLHCVYCRATPRLTALMLGTHVTCHDSHTSQHGAQLRYIGLSLTTSQQLSVHSQQSPKSVPSLSPMRPSHYPLLTPAPLLEAGCWVSPVQYSGRAPTPFSGDKTRCWRHVARLASTCPDTGVTSSRVPSGTSPSPPSVAAFTGAEGYDLWGQASQFHSTYCV